VELREQAVAEVVDGGGEFGFGGWGHGVDL